MENLISSPFTLENCGWLGSILFAICGLPQAIQCYKDGHSRGLNWFFLLAWLGGEIFTIIYVFPKADYPLLANYFMNLVFLGIMLYYKIWERPEKTLTSNFLTN